MNPKTFYKWEDDSRTFTLFSRKDGRPLYVTTLASFREAGALNEAINTIVREEKEEAISDVLRRFQGIIDQETPK